MKKILTLIVVLFMLNTAGHAQITFIDSTTKPFTPEKLPTYMSGMDGWLRFLEKNLDRDIPRKSNAPAGRYMVLASFLVDSIGRVRDIIIENDPGYGTAKEVERIIRLSSKRWNPAMDGGKAISFRHRQSITFVNSY